MQRTRSGWRMTAWISVALLAAALVQFAAVGGVEGIRAAIRLTARTSFVLFITAFTASSLAQTFPSPTTQWLRINRRYLGFAFAFSHLVHLIFIILFVRLDPSNFWIGRTPTSLIPASITYVFIFAMAATSFNRTAKAIGGTAWKWLHWLGSYAIFISFAAAFGGRAAKSGFYIPILVLLTAALLLRVFTRFRRAKITGSQATG
ncbi:MAG: hypothetical protein IPN50_14185 [Sphingomonadales bacterium]|jgi:sulfoxide reductase heme-binding subunit YedZ|nr:hypothetical protein [Sphingomonadales bacterium]